MLCSPKQTTVNSSLSFSNQFFNFFHLYFLPISIIVCSFQATPFITLLEENINPKSRKRIIQTHLGLDVSAKQSYAVCTKTLFTPRLIMKKQTLAQDAFKLYAEKFMTLEDIAKQLHLNERTLCRWKKV